MVSVSGLTVNFGGKVLFEDLNFLINPKDRVGLAGRNGAGKSTLLKILAGINSPDGGVVSKPSSATIGYLPQDLKYLSSKTVFEETATAFDKVKSIQAEIASVTSYISESEEYESEKYVKALNRLEDLNHMLSLLDSANMQGEIEKVLLGLGFKRIDFTRMTDEFSGGWKMRIQLAKILLQKPDVLLLDEPTNHLDIESIQWLEDFLQNYHGAIILVSHDKLFLDNITRRTIEISGGKIYDYKANYSKYLELRAERRAQQMAEAKNQQKYIEHTEELINKFRAKKNKAAFAQSLIKKLDKLDIVEVDDEDKTAIHFKFPEAPRSGKVVLELNNVSKSYGDKRVFSGASLIVEREEKIAFVGKNGEGKSTMSKLIAGLETYEGEIKLGHNVLLGYFAQNQSETLDGERTVFETIDDIATGDIRKNIRGLLGSFLFSGEDADKKVKVLSGGERSRLAMCKLLLKPYNLLLLDEPTNHLDIRSKDVLKKALMDFTGTLIIVSHDRDFLQGLTQKVIEFRDGNVKEFIGSINEFLQYRKAATFSEFELNKAAKEKMVEKEVSATKINYQEKKEQEKQLRKLQNAVSRKEESIASLESQIKQMDDDLCDEVKFKELSKDPLIFKKYEELKTKLEAEMKEWEDLLLQLEQLKS